jgi:hypothetical protein
MLIDTFTDDLLEVLEVRAAHLRPPHHLYLLVDGAFVPGLHEMLEPSMKAVLFEALPVCSEAAKAVSPFLAPFKPADKKIARLCKRCNRWPMLSAVVTPESLHELSHRLASWCIVEVDGQRFNFRFSDTRRLPGIFKTLSVPQRVNLVGPALAWAYVSRNGRWCDLELDGASASIAAEPVLDQGQFAALVDDSRADELMVLLGDRGHTAYGQPARSHALVSTALQAAAEAKLKEEDLLNWCEWFWQRDQLQDLATATLSIEAWRSAVS